MSRGDTSCAPGLLDTSTLPCRLLLAPSLCKLLTASLGQNCGHSLPRGIRRAGGGLRLRHPSCSRDPRGRLADPLTYLLVDLTHGEVLVITGAGHADVLEPAARCRLPGVQAELVSAQVLGDLLRMEEKLDSGWSPARAPEPARCLASSAPDPVKPGCPAVPMPHASGSLGGFAHRAGPSQAA